MESIRRNQMITADLPVHVSLAGIWQSFTSICPERRNKIDNFSPYECKICWINIFAITSQNKITIKRPLCFFFKSQPPLKISNERLVRKALGFFALLLLFFDYEKCFCILIFHILMLIQNKWCIGWRKGKTLNSNADKFLYNNQQLILWRVVLLLKNWSPPKITRLGKFCLPCKKRNKGEFWYENFGSWM